jgi:hypothetical protein
MNQPEEGEIPTTPSEWDSPSPPPMHDEEENEEPFEQVVPLKKRKVDHSIMEEIKNNENSDGLRLNETGQGKEDGLKEEVVPKLENDVEDDLFSQHF